MNAARFILISAASALLAFASPAKDLSDYKIGDRAEADITTPVPLVVIDAEATAELQAREGERVPVVIRHRPQATDAAVADFHKAFIRTRGSFLDAVELGFDTRKLDTNTLASAKFDRLLVSFQKKNPLFPVTPDLARIWAGGEPDKEFEAPFLTGLRDLMNNFIRTTNIVPDGVKVGGTLRVVTYGDNETLTAQMVARHGVNHPKTEFLSFPRAKLNLQNDFPPEQRAAAKYLSEFLQPNCSVETELTVALRAKRGEGLAITDNFAAGQIIVRRGQIVDRKILAALDALREKTAADRLQHLTTQEAVPPAPLPEKNYWLIGAAAGALLILLVSAVIWVRRKLSATLLPARVNRALEPANPNAGSLEWQRQALMAEPRSEKSQAALREGLLAHLARWMSDTFVQRLVRQRADLIETQQQAVTEVDRLGQRLETIHTHLQGRLTAYEQRIAELEKELDTKDEINRELIRAEIQTIRRAMDSERAKGGGVLN